MSFSSYDAIFDAVAAFNSEGLIVYCNEPFSVIVGVSPNRIINKTTLAKLFLEIDGRETNAADFFTKDATNARVTSYKTKSNAEGIGQYCLIPTTDNDQELTLFILRDLTLEEQLKSKYRREMDSKDHKIEEMKSLNNLLQKTRLVKEPNNILREFALHVLTQFRLDRAYLITPEKVVTGIYPKEKADNDPLLTTIGKALLPAQYLVYSSGDFPNLKLGFIPNLERLIVIPVKSQHKSTYLLAIPIYEGTNPQLDHETIKTLAAQMSLMLENMNLEKLSIYDDLTKLYNARFFREKLDEYTSHYKQLQLILLDIDFFKKVNDTYGHLAGDLVLQNMGATLKSMIIKDGVVARVGGEEFAIVIPNQTPEKVLAIAEELANKIRALEMQFDDKTLKITSSFGISTWQPGKMAVREFYKAADEALYRSKKEGRDRITVIDAA